MTYGSKSVFHTMTFKLQLTHISRVKLLSGVVFSAGRVSPTSHHSTTFKVVAVFSVNQNSLMCWQETHEGQLKTPTKEENLDWTTILPYCKSYKSSLQMKLIQ